LPSKASNMLLTTLLLLSHWVLAALHCTLLVMCVDTLWTVYCEPSAINVPFFWRVFSTECQLYYIIQYNASVARRKRSFVFPVEDLHKPHFSLRKHAKTHQRQSRFSKFSWVKLPDPFQQGRRGSIMCPYHTLYHVYSRTTTFDMFSFEFRKRCIHNRTEIMKKQSKASAVWCCSGCLVSN
jgi:hypothetical protein